MLETILKLYVMAMATGVTSPVPHLFGPPGCGKSSVVQELADQIPGCNLHIINVARISPLELEGVQMPVDMDLDERRLELLIAKYWSQLKDGDIVLLDEFLRGFPEVYNGLLDIITSRKVAWFKLPKVFIIAASNSTVSYDKALEDRLMHIPAPDPRKSKTVKKQMGQRIVDQLGLMPDMVDSYEMQTLLDSQVLPMFKVLDHLGKGSSSPVNVEGVSIRNLIGQAQLRHVQVPELKDLISTNNQAAVTKGKFQYVFLLDGVLNTSLMKNTAARIEALPEDKLTPVQRLNRQLNLQLIEVEEVRREKGTTDDDTHVDITDDVFS